MTTSRNMQEYAKLPKDQRMTIGNGTSKQATPDTFGLSMEEYAKLPKDQRMALYQARDEAKREAKQVEEAAKQEAALKAEPNPYRRQLLERQKAGRDYRDTQHLHEARLVALKSKADEWDAAEGEKKRKAEAIARPEVQNVLSQCDFAVKYCAEGERSQVVRAKTLAEQGDYDGAVGIIGAVTTAINARWAAEDEERQQARQTQAEADAKADVERQQARGQLGIQPQPPKNVAPSPLPDLYEASLRANEKNR